MVKNKVGCLTPNEKQCKIIMGYLDIYPFPAYKDL